MQLTTKFPKKVIETAPPPPPPPLPSGEKIAGFFSKVISVLPVSRAAANEMQDRLLVAESDLTTCNTLVWSAAAGMMTAVVMAGVLVWVRARIMDKRHSVKLAHIKSEIARARAQIEVTRLLSRAINFLEQNAEQTQGKTN